MLALHDTARGEVAELRLRRPGEVSVYLCGPTVYDLPHVGHGRHALVWDVVRRYLVWSGHVVRFVSNITDVDDNIIKRAGQEGRAPDDVVAEYEAAWWDALDRLSVLRPDEVPHATAYVERMVELVGELVGRDLAYETSDGVYFGVDAVADYGLLARQSLDSLRAGARVEVNEEKRSPLDFALWKKAKPGEPAWPSPWGDGRPGWHTECVVMALDLLGEGFDLHAGGQDLAFPHHENERAQAVALGRAFASRWAHHAFVVDTGGQKMSKSLGNFTTLTELLARHHPRAYRLLVLRAHYRSPLEVTPDTMADAEKSLARLDDFARNFADAPRDAHDVGSLERFSELMNDDLRTPLALGLVFDLVNEAYAARDLGERERAGVLAATVFDLTAAVGLELRTGEDDVDAETTALVAERDAARAARDYARSDAIRAELQQRGWVVEDTPSGTRVHRSSPAAGARAHP